MNESIQNEKIFVQLASYRDPELIPTIKDLIEQAAVPSNLRICICHQFSAEDEFSKLDEFYNDERFEILDIDHSESKGVCWARNLIQQKYKGEGYTLQLDSHMRFAKDWDIGLIAMLKSLQQIGIRKPMLTAYAPSYDPNNDPEGRVNEPWQLNFDRFLPEGAAMPMPESIPHWQELDGPVPARFYSAHFCFTLGQFAEEVQHNPDYYFHGEEISIGVRAFTHGYDLFHPNKVFMWHEYTRQNSIKQWEDDEEWTQKNHISHYLNRLLFGMDGHDTSLAGTKYGLGRVRTLQSYEEYAGILFENRGVQQYTIDKNYPPNPSIASFGSEGLWKSSFISIFKYCINIYRQELTVEDYDFWAVAYHDNNGNTMHRQDADEEEIRRILENSNDQLHIWRSFNTVISPSYWVVWPHSKSKGWCKKLEGKI